MKNTKLFSRVFFLPFLLIFTTCQLQPDNPPPADNYQKEDYTLFTLGRFAGLDEDTEWSILQAYLKKLKSDGGHDDLTINDVWVEKYCGNYCPRMLTEESKTWEELYYGGPEYQTVVMVKLGYTGQDNGIEQREVSIKYTHGWALVKGGDRLFLWYDGQLYALQDHFPHSLLYSWDFLSIANLQNELDLETQRKIQDDFLEYHESSWPPEYNHSLPIHYLGAYNGYMVQIAYNSSTAMVFRLEIDGVHFYAHSGGPHGNYLFGWKEGQITMLTDLFEQGLVTHEDLVEMAYNLNYEGEY